MDKDYGWRSKGLFWFHTFDGDGSFTIIKGLLEERSCLPLLTNSRLHLLQAFLDISRYLHFVDNSKLIPRGQPGHDCLGKVWPVIDHLFQRVSDLYDPHCELAVDEAMIKFQGRSSFKQYMPMKPIKRGIKVWVLGDSHNGCWHEFQIYSGKEGTREVNLKARVVKTLTNHLRGKFHHIFFDNFFTSLKWLEDLEADGLYGCGTVCKHRIGFPPTLKTLKLTNRYNAFK